jgi:hypothetical protein
MERSNSAKTPSIGRALSPLASSICPVSISLPKLNPIEPPWYGPVCPVVWEGRHREVSPYLSDAHSRARRFVQMQAPARHCFQRRACMATGHRNDLREDIGCLGWAR